jgi:hypothetical protein
VSTKDFTAGVAKVLSAGIDTIYVGWKGEGLAQLFQALVAQGAFETDSPVTVTSLAPAPEELATVANAIGNEALANFSWSASTPRTPPGRTRRRRSPRTSRRPTTISRSVPSRRTATSPRRCS